VWCGRFHQFDLPEPGQWFLDAECSGQHVSIQPPAIQVISTPFRSHSLARCRPSMCMSSQPTLLGLDNFQCRDQR
jgi:hypothetical protein